MKTRGFTAETETARLARLSCAATNALTAAQESDSSTEEQIAALEQASDAALTAWNQSRIADAMNH